MNTTTITPANWNDSKGATVILRTVKGETITGTLISLNSKGWNVKDDAGRTITRTEAVTVSLELETWSLVNDATEAFEDIDLNFEEIDLDDADDLEIEDDATDADMPEGDGHTTAELAALFNTSARALRVQLRKLGLGVGKGRRYYLTDEELATVREAITA